MKTLPKGVWNCIAQHIPALSLKDMISVNRFFFNLAMDYRYRQISFTYLTERMLWMLVRLKDPAVSYRVRTIYIYPDFLKEDLYADHPIHINGGYSKDRANILRYKLFLKSGKCCLRPKFLVEWMQDVLSGLHNVTDYHITWTGLPGLLQNPASLISTVFRTAPIERLTLTISVKNIEALDMNTFRCLRNLQELEILLQHEDTFLWDDSSPLSRLSAAIKNVRKTLKTLAIESWGPIRLSELLSRIDHFPRLEKLLVTLPANDVQLGDPTKLTAFLDLHRDNLRVLALRAEASGQGMGRSDPFFLDYWLQEALQGITLSKLQTLEINSSRILPETCLACVKAFAPSLTSFSLTGQHQSVQFIDQVISAFSECDRDLDALESLRLGTITLKPTLIDLLAEKLPGLQKLTLTIKDLKPSLPPSPPHGSSHHLSRCQRREEQLEAFFSEMETRRYSEWRLRHVKLVLCMEDAEYWQTHVEALLAECVPSIRNFA